MSAVTFTVTAALIVVAGIAIGATSVGGVLVIPALTAIAGVELRAAVAATSFAFLATGALALVDAAAARRGADAGAAAPPLDLALHLSALVGASLGALAVHVVPGRWVLAWIGVLAFVSGVQALAGPPRAVPRPWPRAPLQAAIGLAVGIGSALSGTGGPILLLPLLLLLGQEPRRAVAAALILQMPIAVASTTVHLVAGRLDLRLGAAVAVALVAGAWLGRRLARRIDTGPLRRATGLVLLATSAAIAFT